MTDDIVFCYCYRLHVHKLLDPTAIIAVWLPQLRTHVLKIRNLIRKLIFAIKHFRGSAKIAFQNIRVLQILQATPPEGLAFETIKQEL